MMALYGFHKILTIWRFYHDRANKPSPLFRYPTSDLPKVTVQLPIFNEMYVAERLIEAIAKLEYPSQKLEIQVLDDSTDETQLICQRKVAQLKSENFDITYLHRENRRGFKAGALAAGLRQAKGELALIFDADFVPAPNILIQMVDYFSDPKIGMVQARWGHLNRQYSILTEIQALMLDGHFVIEQTARNKSGCFFNFNGTAGILRISAISEAGGWQHSTVTEDLDLSYRLQLKGWRCIYLPNLVVAAELPIEMNSFKSQQFRWAKGASQVAKKLLIPILRSKQPFYVKLEAVLHMTNNLNYFLLVTILVLSLPYQMYVSQNNLNYSIFIYLPIFIGTNFNLLFFYWISQRERTSYFERKETFSPWKFGLNIFGLMAIGIGLSINQSLAVCEGFIRVGTEFVRTPKYGLIRKRESWRAKKYRGDKTFWIFCLESLMVCYLLITILFTIHVGQYLSLPFLFLFTLGHLYVLTLGLFQRS